MTGYVLGKCNLQMHKTIIKQVTRSNQLVAWVPFVNTIYMCIWYQFSLEDQFCLWRSLHIWCMWCSMNFRITSTTEWNSTTVIVKIKVKPRALFYNKRTFIGNLMLIIIDIEKKICRVDMWKQRCAC